MRSGFEPHEFGLGRIEIPDPRDGNYPVTTLLAWAESVEAQETGEPIPDKPRFWNDNQWWGNQKQLPQCVGYAWAHYLEDGPVTQPGKPPIKPPAEIYHAAQQVDQWPGDHYDGTSVRAAAKVLQDDGFISSYWWATIADEVARTVLLGGPVVVGTNWTYSMFNPQANGLVHYDMSTGLAGGHAWVINGYNPKTRVFRAKNSWGQSWGRSGRFYVGYDDLEALLRDGGEACLPIEVRQPPKPRRELSTENEEDLAPAKPNPVPGVEPEKPKKPAKKATKKS